MGDLLRDFSIKGYNTFGIDVTAKVYSAFRDLTELDSLLETCNRDPMQLLILGGGSNILFTKNFEGYVFKNSIPGIETVDEDKGYAFIKAGSGVIWHELVTWCVGKGLGGVENLSLIPGCVGAAPIQNIGAYGVELKDSFFQLEAVEIESGNRMQFSNSECRFGYRDSIFKREGKGKYVITSVTLKLSKQPELKLSYGAIKKELEGMGIDDPDVKSVSQAVCNIRRSKLPDPAKLGNAGSFFKNPEIDESGFRELATSFPNIVGYPASPGKVKVAAGWLIEQCGWKGRRVGNTGSHKDQALVLVNYGGATGNEVVELASEIRKSVREKFGVEIEPEVNII